MAHERFDIPVKEMNDYEDDFENDGLDDFSDDYDDDDQYPYTDLIPHEMENRRGNSFSGSGNSNEINEDNRKDHHNQLERKRRASIKSSYTELREAIPSLRDNKASRSVILQKAVDYLEELNRRNIDHVSCVDHFSTENLALEAKCREIENQIQTIMRQQRQSSLASGASNSSNGHNFTITLPPRPSFRARDEEDSNDLTAGSTNSTPTASTSRSIASSSNASSSTTASNPRAETTSIHERGKSVSAETRPLLSLLDRRNNPTDTGSNSSSLPDYYDDIEEVIPPKKPRKE